VRAFTTEGRLAFARLWVRLLIEESILARRSLMSGRSRKRARVSTEMLWIWAISRKERSGSVVASMMAAVWAGSGEKGGRSGKVAEWSSGKVEEEEGTGDWALGIGEGQDEDRPRSGISEWAGAGWEVAGCMGRGKSGVLYRGAKDMICAQKDGLCARPGRWGGLLARGNGLISGVF
jgi:hypothetical protein